MPNSDFERWEEENTGDSVLQAELNDLGEKFSAAESRLEQAIKNNNTSDAAKAYVETEDLLRRRREINQTILKFYESQPESLSDEFIQRVKSGVKKHKGNLGKIDAAEKRLAGAKVSIPEESLQQARAQRAFEQSRAIVLHEVGKKRDANSELALDLRMKLMLIQEHLVKEGVVTGSLQQEISAFLQEAMNYIRAKGGSLTENLQVLLGDLQQTQERVMPAIELDDEFIEIETWGVKQEQSLLQEQPSLSNLFFQLREQLISEGVFRTLPAIELPGSKEAGHKSEFSARTEIYKTQLENLNVAIAEESSLAEEHTEVEKISTSLERLSKIDEELIGILQAIGNDDDFDEVKVAVQQLQNQILLPLQKKLEKKIETLVVAVPEPQRGLPAQPNGTPEPIAQSKPQFLFDLGIKDALQVFEARYKRLMQQKSDNVNFKPILEKEGGEEKLAAIKATFGGEHELTVSAEAGKLPVVSGQLVVGQTQQATNFYELVKTSASDPENFNYVISGVNDAEAVAMFRAALQAGHPEGRLKIQDKEAEEVAEIIKQARATLTQPVLPTDASIGNGRGKVYKKTNSVQNIAQDSGSQVKSLRTQGSRIKI